jgi:CheY-like chemotaxis protein
MLKLDFPEDLPAVEADATQVRQVVMNLITNASEAIGDQSGLLTVRTGTMEADRAYLSEVHLDDDLPAGSYVFIEVTDTGCGMEEAVQAKIFDPFFTTKFTGRGLGLAAVLGIVRGHRGAIRIQSEVGRGTAIRVLFPASDRTIVPALVAEGACSEKFRGTGTVLVVDDEEDVRRVARRMLEESGFTVLTANDGREALDVFREHSDAIVAVVLDLTMPFLSGEGVFREMRRMRADARVILSSGYNEQEAIDRFAGKGLAGFLQKPYRSETLLETLHEIMNA